MGKENPVIRRKEIPQLHSWWCFASFHSESRQCEKSQGMIAAGVAGNGVINFGCLFEIVTLTGRLTGAESRSKCGHWMMLCRWRVTFSRTPSNWTEPSWLPPGSNQTLLSHSGYFSLSLFIFCLPIVLPLLLPLPFLSTSPTSLLARCFNFFGKA